MVKSIFKRSNVLEKESLKDFSKDINENNKVIKTNKEDMNVKDLMTADNIIGSINDKKNVKRVKSEKGLIERVENEKIVLTEDNKMLLKD